MAQDLEIHVEEREPATLVHLHGALTFNTGARLRDRIRELVADGKRKIALGLEGVNRIDSAGLGELVAAYTAVTSDGGKLALVQPSRKVADLLQVTQLITVFPVFDSVDEALAFLGHGNRPSA